MGDFLTSAGTYNVSESIYLIYLVEDEVAKYHSMLK